MKPPNATTTNTNSATLTSSYNVGSNVTLRLSKCRLGPSILRLVPVSH